MTYRSGIAYCPKHQAYIGPVYWCDGRGWGWGLFGCRHAEPGWHLLPYSPGDAFFGTPPRMRLEIHRSTSDCLEPISVKEVES